MGATSAFAQRVCDFQVTLASPTSSTVLTPGTAAFNLDVVIKNNGPDSFKSTSVTDTILWYATIQGSKISFTIGSNTGTNWLRWNVPIKSGDTAHITFNGLSFSGYTGVADSMRTLCFYANPKGKAADTIKDNNLTNNSSCATFKFGKTPPAGINTVAKSGVNNVTLYPNPAAATANFDFETAINAAVNVNILDMAGRLVAEENKGEVKAGKHSIQVNTSNLPNGDYIYQVYVGNNVTIGKLTISK